MLQEQAGAGTRAFARAAIADHGVQPRVLTHCAPLPERPRETWRRGAEAPTLAIAAWRGWHRAGFIAGVFALLWFSHGVMLAWSEPAQRWMALVEVTLSLVIIYAACMPGARARREKQHSKAG